MISRRGVLRDFLRTNHMEAIGFLSGLLFMLIVLALFFWLIPFWVPAGYIVQSMRIAAFWLLVASVCFGFLLDEGLGKGRDVAFITQFLLMEAVGMVTVCGTLWLLDEFDDPTLTRFFVIICVVGIGSGVMFRLLFPPLSWWRSLMTSIFGMRREKE